MLPQTTICRGVLMGKLQYSPRAGPAVEAAGQKQRAVAHRRQAPPSFSLAADRASRLRVALPLH